MVKDEEAKEEERERRTRERESTRTRSSLFCYGEKKSITASGGMVGSTGLDSRLAVK